MKILPNAFLTVTLGTLAVRLCAGAQAVPEERVYDFDAKRFDLDFNGGVPEALVQAVEKATKEPLNVIIPREHKDFALPPLKLRNVTVPQLFVAIGASSKKQETRYYGNSFQRVNTSYGFKTGDQPPHTKSIWYFNVEDPGGRPTALPPPKQCRYWQLEPYLDKLKVEDITTAIETGWKMLGVNPFPKLTFHKDTRLLVAVGEDDQLRTVDDVLRQLTPKVDSATGLPPIQSGKTEGDKPSKR